MTQDIWFVYIVECSDQNKTLYTGIAKDIDKRVQQHNDGKGARYTKGRGPVKLLKQFICQSKSEALKLEYRIKQLPREQKLTFDPETLKPVDI